MTLYRQIAHRIRLNGRDGQPDRVSERPRSGSRERGWGDYADGPDNPTTIELGPDDGADIAQLLRTGAIEALPEPAADAPAAPAAEKGGRRGKGTG